MKVTNLEKLFDLQKDLDARIRREHLLQTNEYEYRLNKKLLALLVEIGELANETRCFKFWSHMQKPRSRDRVLEKGVDVLHFLLAIGIDLGIKPRKYETISKIDLTGQFLALYDSARFCARSDEWHWTFRLYLTLMESLGFSWIEIEKAYIKKNAINHERQNSGY